MKRATTCSWILVALASPLGAQHYAGQYWPIDAGYSWTYVNSTDPLDTEIETVIGPTMFGGQLAWELSNGTESVFIGNDGMTFTVYGYAENGTVIDFPDVVMGAVADGDSFQLGLDQLLVWREWSALDHSLTGAYGVNPELCDVLLLVSYDMTVGIPNSQNVILESGGAPAQPYAATYLTWFQKGVGPYADLGFYPDGTFEGPRYDAFASFVLGRNYCTSLPNSATTGVQTCGAVIRATGSASITANNLSLTSEPTPPGEPGIFYYGPSALFGAPFGNGVRCVGGPTGTVVRIFPFVTAGPGGLMSTTIVNSLPAHAQLVPGATLNFQSWFRDPLGGGSGFNLSNGLSVTFQP